MLLSDLLCAIPSGDLAKMQTHSIVLGGSRRFHISMKHSDAAEATGTRTMNTMDIFCWMCNLGIRGLGMWSESHYLWGWWPKSWRWMKSIRQIIGSKKKSKELRSTLSKERKSSMVRAVNIKEKGNLNLEKFPTV